MVVGETNLQFPDKFELKSREKSIKTCDYRMAFSDQFGLSGSYWNNQNRHFCAELPFTKRIHRIKKSNRLFWRRGILNLDKKVNTDDTFWRFRPFSLPKRTLWTKFSLSRFFLEDGNGWLTHRLKGSTGLFCWKLSLIQAKSLRRRRPDNGF